MEKQIPLPESGRADDPEYDRLRDDGTHGVTEDVAYRRLFLVNVVYFGALGAGDREWVMSTLSRFYPRGPITVGPGLQDLPEDGSVPFMPGWRWLATPGHTPGHVSLWRESDRTLIAGDAFITTDQESAYAVAVQRPVLQGPPMYYTQNWQQARESVRMLAALEPETAVTGHGMAFGGSELRDALFRLAGDFDAIAVPEHGRYVREPATVTEGTAYAPPNAPDR